MIFDDGKTGQKAQDSEIVTVSFRIAALFEEDQYAEDNSPSQGEVRAPDVALVKSPGAFVGVC